MFLEIALAIAVVLLLVALAVCVLLHRSRVAITHKLAEADALNESLRETNRQLDTEAAVARKGLEETEAVRATADKLRDENTDLVKQVERLSADRQALEQLHKKLDDSLAGLATKSLNESNKQFLELAKKTFESEKKDADASLKQRQVAIETLATPIQENLH